MFRMNGTPRAQEAHDCRDKVRPVIGREGGLGHVRRDCVSFAQSRALPAGRQGHAVPYFRGCEPLPGDSVATSCRSRP